MSRRPLFCLLLALVAMLAVPGAAHATPPVNTAVPGLTGQYRVGQELTATAGTWTSNAGALQFVQTWERCNSDGDVCTTIAGRTGLKYTLQSADLGRTIRIAIRATNTDGTTTARSAVTPPVADRQPPTPDPALPPTVSGLAREGLSLSSTPGEWFGPDPITKATRWQRCDAALTDCTTLSASAPTYKLTVADIGSVMRVEVTATNPDGTSSPVLSNASAVVEGVPPANTARPTLAGDAREGQTLSIKTFGTWTGTQPLTATYRWEECSALGEEPCAAVDGATTTTFPLGSSHIGRTYRAVVTQTNITGPANAASASTLISAQVTEKRPPVQLTAPAVTGTVEDQQTLSASDGTWEGTASITTTRQWQRCNAAGLACVDVTGTGPTYKLGPADVGSAIRTRVLAKNADGETSAFAAPTALVRHAPPVATANPAISGAATDGTELSTTNGTFKGTAPFTYTYAWQACEGAPSVCVAVGGDASKLRLTSDEIGKTIKVTVTAGNGGGDGSATSSSTAAVVAGPPISIAKPTISAPQVRDGQLLTADAGTWGGTGTPAFSYQWQRCSATGTGCAVIAGPNESTYRVQGADVGKTVKAVVTAATPYGSTSAASDASPVVVATPPTINGAVTISGIQRDGQTVTAVHAWNGTQPMQHTYQWQRCVLTCVDITGATLATYKLTPTDVSTRMRVRVTATNTAGTAQASSSDDPADPVVGADPPVRTGDPAITGTAKEGLTLTASAGTFTGTAPLPRSYEWLRCDADALNCVPIGGATSATYVLQELDRNVTVRVRVTATNSGGSDSGTSLPSAVVGMSAPAGTIAPAVTPNHGLRDGALLTTTNGTWFGSKPMTYTYQWQRCNPAGASCVNIVGAAEQTYRITGSEVGFTMRVNVTATNGAGSDTKASLVTGIVGTNPPSNDVAPALSIGGDGIAIDGAVLHTTVGAWSGVVPMTTTYEWRRCDTTGENCGTIPGATESSYELTPADVGLTVRAYVIQANAGGTNGALTAPTPTIVGAPPVNLARPAITGGAAIGRTLTAVPGVWSGTPELRFDFQWMSCDVGGDNCTDIAGAQASTYLVKPDDAAMSLRVRVTASNAVDDATEVSLSTGEVQTQPPSIIDAPSIHNPGLLAQGTILEARAGEWGGAQPVTEAYQWRRCAPALTGCANITDATGPSYELTKDDVGKRIILVVKATNVVGDFDTQTDPTHAVLPEPPSNQTAPTIVSTGTLRDGSKLTVNNGTWKGATPMTFAVNWLRCDAAGANCIPATDVTTGTYTLTSEDVGRRMRARVTAKNAATEVPVETTATTVVAAAMPASSLRPAVVALDGKAQVGGRLRGASGTWTGTNPMTLSLQWQRCVGSTTAACDDVPGATSDEYILRESDVGKRMRLVVTATNAGGTVSSESSPTEVVPAIPPDSAGVPAIAGGPIREGVTLTGVAGTWTGSTPITLGFQWERCNDPGAASCPKIAGATRETFTPTSADVGKYVRLTVTGVNSGGKAARSSVPTSAVEGITPSNVSAPTARAGGSIKVGTSMTSTTGKWAGSAPIKFETRWQACDPTGATCEDVEGGNKPIYKLKSEDVTGALLARPMRVVVTATNLAGTAEAVSAPVGELVAAGAAGAAGDEAAGAAARRKKKAAAKRLGVKGADGWPVSTGKTLARIKRMKFTPKGRLLIALHCPKKAKSTCGAFGTITSGKLKFKLDAGPLPKGKSKNFGFLLTKQDRGRMRGRKRIDFTVKLRPPSSAKKAKATKKRVAVPKKLRGKIKKATTKKSSSKTKTMAGSKTKAGSRTKPKATRTDTDAPTTTTPSTPPAPATKTESPAASTGAAGAPPA